MRLDLLDYLDAGGEGVGLYDGVEQRRPRSAKDADCFGLDQPDLDAALRIDLSQVVEVLGQRAELKLCSTNNSSSSANAVPSAVVSSLAHSSRFSRTLGCSRDR